MTHNYQTECGKCGAIEQRNDDRVPTDAVRILVGSCLTCTPDSIATTYVYYDAEGRRVGQDAARGGG